MTTRSYRGNGFITKKRKKNKGTKLKTGKYCTTIFRATRRRFVKSERENEEKERTTNGRAIVSRIEFESTGAAGTSQRGRTVENVVERK